MYSYIEICTLSVKCQAKRRVWYLFGELIWTADPGIDPTLFGAGCQSQQEQPRLLLVTIATGLQTLKLHVA